MLQEQKANLLDDINLLGDQLKDLLAQKEGDEETARSRKEQRLLQEEELASMAVKVEDVHIQEWVSSGIPERFRVCFHMNRGGLVATS